MKVIVTRYALTSGVLLEDVEPCEKTPTMVQVKRVQGYYLHKPDWHTSKGSATSRVRLMATHKRGNLAKQLAELPDREERAYQAIEEAQL